jgi:hypothetical protein
LYDDIGYKGRQDYGDNGDNGHINPPLEMEGRYLYGHFVGLISVACV